MREAQLPNNVRQLEIRPEAAAEILERATNLSGKIFHKFCRLQQTLRGDRVPGAIRRPDSHTLCRCFQQPVMIYERGSRNPRSFGALAFSLRYSA